MDVLRIDAKKQGYLESLSKHEIQAANAKAMIAECDTALADTDRLISEATTGYNRTKINAQNLLAGAIESLVALKAKIEAEGAHSAAEIAEYTAVITEANS